MDNNSNINNERLRAFIERIMANREERANAQPDSERAKAFLERLKTLRKEDNDNQ